MVRQRINLNYFFIGNGNWSGDTSFNESVKDIRFSNLYANSFKQYAVFFDAPDRIFKIVNDHVQVFQMANLSFSPGHWWGEIIGVGTLAGW